SHFSHLHYFPTRRSSDLFVLQAVSYEYRRKPNNVFGEKTFDWFLKINGFLGTILLGAAVGTFFTGANFTVDRFNMANLGGDTTRSEEHTSELQSRFDLVC